MKKSNFLLPCLVVWTMILFRPTDQLEIVYAVNCGGDTFTDSHGITYQKDPLTEGGTNNWVQTMRGVSDQDRFIYQTHRYNHEAISYDLPLTGDGWYGLLLHFADDSGPKTHRRRMGVTLNGQHTLLADLDMFRDCGENNVCNHIFYFKVCQRTLYYAGQTSSLGDVSKVNVMIKRNDVSAIIDGILMVKGVAGEGLPIVGTTTVFYFVPNDEVQCEGSQGPIDLPFSENEIKNQCRNTLPISIVLNIPGSTKQTFKCVPEIM
jgi:Malectin domain